MNEGSAPTLRDARYRLEAARLLHREGVPPRRHLARILRRVDEHYAAAFDANGLASGIYRYTLRASNFMQARRLVLLR